MVTTDLNFGIIASFTTIDYQRGVSKKLIVTYEFKEPEPGGGLFFRKKHKGYCVQEFNGVDYLPVFYSETRGGAFAVALDLLKI